MRVTLNIYGSRSKEEEDTLLTLEVFPEMTVGTLRESIKAEKSIAPMSQHIYHNGRIISDDTKTLAQLELADGDMLAVHVRDTHVRADPPAQLAEQHPQYQQQQHQAPRAQFDPEIVRLQLLGNPAMRQQVQQQHPELAASLEDPARFAEVLRVSQERERRDRLERQREIERLNEDPFDVDNQHKIMEMIRQERVMENLQTAMEHNPEVFGRVHMLYLDVEVNNGYKVKALVDSGAQATIMSPACADACGIAHLIDTRFAGVARGVGTAKITGRVHTAPIRIGNLFLPCSFTVMEGKAVDLLLGLDMLKRYQACIDLAKGCLVIQDEEIPFLGEAEIPKEEEEQAAQEPTIPGPAGTQIGQRTGAVMPAPGDQQSSDQQLSDQQLSDQQPSEQQPSEQQPAEHQRSGQQTSGQQLSGQQPSGQQPSQNPTETTHSAAGVAGAAAGTENSDLPYTPQHVDTLVNLGAERLEAIRALQAAQDNVDAAAGFLFFS